MPNKTITSGVAFDVLLYGDIKKRAKEVRRSVSGYIRELAIADLAIADINKGKRDETRKPT